MFILLLLLLLFLFLLLVWLLLTLLPRFEKFMQALSQCELEKFDDIYSDSKWLEGKTAKKTNGRTEVGRLLLLLLHQLLPRWKPPLVQAMCTSYWRATLRRASGRRLREGRWPPTYLYSLNSFGRQNARVGQDACSGARA